jgi:hypothetical protein
LLVLVAVVASPVRAGGSASVHVGGSYGGGYHGYHGYSGGSYGGHGYYGRSMSGYRGFHGYYGGYGLYPSYGYSSYGYGPGYDYTDYGSPSDYGTGYDAPVYPYASPAPTAPATAPTPAVAGPVMAPGAGGNLAMGKIDDFGFIHSPFSTATFKSDKMAPGQIFYDPITGQAFTVAKPEPPPATAPSTAPTTSTAPPAGKLDEFGYVHSPFSTFTFKVQNGNFAQVFRDPFTGQTFTVHPKQAAQTTVQATPAGAAQASD